MDHLIPDPKAVRRVFDTLAYGALVLLGVIAWHLVQRPHELAIVVLEFQDDRVWQLVRPVDPDLPPIKATYAAQISEMDGQPVCSGTGTHPYEWKLAPLEFTYSDWVGADCAALVEGRRYRADLVLSYTDSRGRARTLPAIPTREFVK